MEKLSTESGDWSIRIPLSPPLVLKRLLQFSSSFHFLSLFFFLIHQKKNIEALWFIHVQAHAHAFLLARSLCLPADFFEIQRRRSYFDFYSVRRFFLRFLNPYFPFFFSSVCGRWINRCASVTWRRRKKRRFTWFFRWIFTATDASPGSSD